MTTCRDMSTLLEPFSDGELLPERVIEVEQHLENCERCAARVRLDRSMRVSMRKVVYEAAPPSQAFMARLGAALEAERLRETQLMESERPAGTVHALRWRTIAPIAAAAALVTLWAATTQRDAQHRADHKDQHQGPHLASTEPVNLDQFLDDLVDHHLNPEKPAVTEPALLEQLDPEVGVPVRLPSLSGYGARWEGASVVPISDVRVRDQRDGVTRLPRGRHAAVLRYHVGGHKMTLYVYDAAKVPLERRLQQRVVRNEPVYVGWKRGFSIAATERRGVGYAVATDLDDRESAEIVASLHH